MLLSASSTIVKPSIDQNPKLFENKRHLIQSFFFLNQLQIIIAIER